MGKENGEGRGDDNGVRKTDSTNCRDDDPNCVGGIPVRSTNCTLFTHWRVIFGFGGCDRGG